jgi:riboflavin biosynthesis protein RibD
MTNDEKYMRRAIQLAKCGEAAVAPNPMVGAVIVYKDRIIGEGYHQKYGGPHAEVNAVRSVHIVEGKTIHCLCGDNTLSDARQYFAQSTIYVTLEPCSHWGKTPPCCEMIIANGFGRVVVGMQDPNAKVDGEGIRRMREAGIEVVEARITYLAYAPEIAAVMLQRQQASAIIDARKMIVDGAVGMVEMALDRLSKNNTIELDEERKAAMVSNLLVVLCGNRDAQPVVNSGSLY